MHSLRFTAIAAALSIVLIGAGCAKNSPETTTGQAITLSMTELAKHSSSSDCWLLISGSVYDVTSFIQRHPGGAQRIISNCGRDATTAFQTQDGQGSHSSAAMEQLAGLRLGSLNAVVSLPN